MLSMVDTYVVMYRYERMIEIHYEKEMTDLESARIDRLVAVAQIVGGGKILPSVPCLLGQY